MSWKKNGWIKTQTASCLLYTSLSRKLHCVIFPEEFDNGSDVIARGYKLLDN